MTDSQNLLALWGKTTKGDSTGENYHPALFHMVDVGVVAEALLQSGDLRLRQALLHAWNGVDSDAFIAWLPFLCSIHDLGKISAVFQGQRKKHDTQQQYQRLKNVGIDIPHPPLDAPYHQEISAVWIQQHIERHEGSVPSQRFGQFATQLVGITGALLNACEAFDSASLLRSSMICPGMNGVSRAMWHYGISFCRKPHHSL